MKEFFKLASVNNLSKKEKIAIKLAAFFIVMLSLSMYFKENYKINITSSLPEGIYEIEKSWQYDYQDVVLFDYKECCKLPDPSLPPYNNMMKIITGTPGDEIKHLEDGSILLKKKNGEEIVFSVKKESKGGFPIPIIKEGVIPKDYYFMTTNHKASFDSRYYGLVHKKFFKGKGSPVILF